MNPSPRIAVVTGAGTGIGRAAALALLRDGWSVVLAGRRAYRSPQSYAVETRFLTPETTPGLFLFPRDMTRVEAEVNRLNNQVLVRYFEQEWRQVIR